MFTWTERMGQVIFILLVKCLLLQDLVLGMRSNNNNNDPGEPLYLTPLLEGNKIAEAKQRSRVSPDIGNVTSYSGFFTINKACESNSFFWFFPAQKNWRKAPVVLWLQGGPGQTSMSSVFIEVGPLSYENKIETWEYSWNVENNLLFIDQPVGTGYSYTGKGCYAQNETDVGRDLYSGVLQFYQLFPELQENKFFITGQSYAGHFIPALGYTIHTNNPTANMKVNLGGMMIGNGWMDAYYQYDLASYLYQLGLIDDAGRDYYNERQDKFLEFLRNKDYESAIQIYDALFGEIHRQYVGNITILNYLIDVTEQETATYESYIQLPKIRKAIHVGNRNFSAFSLVVESSLGVDPVLSVKPWVEELLEHYFIVFYTGQLDIVCGYPMVVNFLKNLDWSGKGNFKKATREKWCIGDKQVGYFKGTHNLYDVFVRNAEHSVPFGQPFWAYVLANTVTSGTPDNPIRGLNSC